MPGIKFPSFKDFVSSQNPAMAFVYVCLIAISVMFTIIIKANSRHNEENKENYKTCISRTDKLSTEVSFLTEQIRRKDSAWAALNSRVAVLTELKIIPPQ